MKIETSSPREVERRNIHRRSNVVWILGEQLQVEGGAGAIFVVRLQLDCGSFDVVSSVNLTLSVAASGNSMQEGIIDNRIDW